LQRRRPTRNSKRLKDELDRQSRTLDQALGDRLVSLKDYYAAQTALETREIDAGIARTRAALAEQQRLVAEGKDDSVRVKARAEVAKLEADLILLNNKRTDIEVTNARKAADAERGMRDELAHVRAELLDLTGTATSADRRAAIEQQYRDLIKRLQAEGDTAGIATVTRLVDLKAASADLDAYERQFNEALSRMRAAEASVNLQRESGLLTQSQAQAQILALHRETATTLEGLLPELQAAATAIGPEATARVQDWKNAIAEVRHVTDDVAVAIDGAVQDSFASLFESIGSGAASARQAFADFARSVLASINRIASQNLAESLFGSLFGAAGATGGASPGTLLSSLLQGSQALADGGYVSGPGTATSDSIPARLSTGEYVLRAEAVRRWGVAFLDTLNGRSLPASPSLGRMAFAAGGLVPEPARTGASAQPIRMVLVDDRANIGDYLASSEGERVIMQTLRRNSMTLRNILGG
jgi:hypothetical protein